MPRLVLAREAHQSLGSRPWQWQRTNLEVCPSHFFTVFFQRNTFHYYQGKQSRSHPGLPRRLPVSFPFLSEGEVEACRQTKALPDPPAACIHHHLTFSRVATPTLVRPPCCFSSATYVAYHLMLSYKLHLLVNKKYTHPPHDPKKKTMSGHGAIFSQRWNGDHLARENRETKATTRRKSRKRLHLKASNLDRSPCLSSTVPSPRLPDQPNNQSGSAPDRITHKPILTQMVTRLRSQAN